MSFLLRCSVEKSIRITGSPLQKVFIFSGHNNTNLWDAKIFNGLRVSPSRSMGYVFLLRVCLTNSVLHTWSVVIKLVALLELWVAQSSTLFTKQDSDVITNILHVRDRGFPEARSTIYKAAMGWKRANVVKFNALPTDEWLTVATQVKRHDNEFECTKNATTIARKSGAQIERFHFDRGYSFESKILACTKHGEQDLSKTICVIATVQIFHLCFRPRDTKILRVPPRSTSNSDSEIYVKYRQ